MQEDRGAGDGTTAADPDRAGRRRRRPADERADRAREAGDRDQRRAALPGSPDHGRVPGDRRGLPRHRELRAARHREVRVQLAVGLPGPLPRARDHGAPRQRVRPGRDQRVHRVPGEAPLRHDRRARHHRLQRRRPRPAVRDQLQPRDQHPRDHLARAVLGGRRVADHRAARGEPDVRLSRGHRPEEDLPPLSRGARVDRQALPDAAPRAVLDDLLGELPDPPPRARERRHDLDQAGRLPGPGDHPAAVPEGAPARSGEPRPADQGQDLHRLPGARPQGRQGEGRVRLQHLRPRGDLPRGAGARRSPTPPACRR